MMKPTRNDYHAAMSLLSEAIRRQCDLADVRVYLRTDATGDVTEDTSGILSYTAGMWAAAEATHYTKAQFARACAAARAAIDACPPPPVTTTPCCRTSGSATTPRKHGNHDDRKKAEKTGAILGLTDRNGDPYKLGVTP